ncbi:MAG: hypothetical protein MUO77_00695 [Anaerolineales bacterium]|nr:hypothetical protein [Anaerolineales bacterium]
MLYYIRKDNEIDAKSPIRTNQLANLNRIFVLDQRLIIGSATDVVQNAVDAYSDQIPSLADNDEYLAAVLALENDILGDKGNLVGAVFTDSKMFSNLGPIPDSYHQKPLHVFDLAIFATLQKADTAYLVLALVFPNGIDAQSNADIIAERLKDYTSLRYKGKLDDYWTFEKADGIEANGLPVALVVMRAEASEAKEITAGIYGVTIWRWIDMIEARDLLFLISEP